MTVPFKDAAEVEAGGTAAFLRIVPGGQPDERRGALFQVNSRGAPVEFSFNRVDLPSASLWLPEQLERQAAKALATSLFEAARRTPLVLLYLASELDARLFSEDLEIQIPVCRMAAESNVLPPPGEPFESLQAEGQNVHVFWRPNLPSPESPSRRLLAMLAARGLLLEPFERAMTGLEEALGSQRTGGEVE